MDTNTNTLPPAGQIPGVGSDGLLALLRSGPKGDYDGYKSDKLMQEAADEIQRLRDALGKIERHGPIMGSTGDYRQGQIDILETVSTIAGLALCANIQAQPCGQNLPPT